jgi:hypothetical protein
VLATRPGQRLHPDALAAAAAGAAAQGGAPATVGPVPLDAMRMLHEATFRRAGGLDDLLRLATGSRGYLASVVSRLNASLRSQVRPHAGPYLVRGGRKSGGYWLPLEPSLIRFSGLSTDASSKGAA